MEYFILEVASHNFLYDKISREYKKAEMKIYVIYTIMNIGTPEIKGVFSKRRKKLNALHSPDSVSDFY